MKANLLCRLFGHKFSEWEYIVDDSCEQVRVCKRDGYKQSRMASHQFGEWEYIVDDSCEQVRVCKRDGYEERRTRHQIEHKQEKVESDRLGGTRVTEYCTRCDQTINTWMADVLWDYSDNR